MYHRYMPTGNGQFQRKSVPDPPPRSNPAPVPLQRTEMSMPPPKPPSAEAETLPDAGMRRPTLPFLNRLLPGMDSGDLLVMLILLLLLMEGGEDSNELIMTLAIFLFLQ